MYENLVRWIGSQTCAVAGDLSDVLQSQVGCAHGQSLNMGYVVLGLLALSIAVMVINARRRKFRRNFYMR